MRHMAKKPWGKGNPLYDWIQKHRKPKKTRKSKVYKSPKTHKSPVRHMGKKRRRSARSFLNFQTLGKFVRLGAFVAPGKEMWDMYQGNVGDQVLGTIGAYSGYQLGTKSWEWALLAKMWTPYLASNLVTHGISKLNGIIRRL